MQGRGQGQRPYFLFSPPPSVVSCFPCAGSSLRRPWPWVVILPFCLLPRPVPRLATVGGLSGQHSNWVSRLLSFLAGLPLRREGCCLSLYFRSPLPSAPQSHLPAERWPFPPPPRPPPGALVGFLARCFLFTSTKALHALCSQTATILHTRKGDLGKQTTQTPSLLGFGPHRRGKQQTALPTW